MSDDKYKGLYGKFFVARVDGGSELGGKHYGCDYFVLDLTHDKFALPAIRAYAKSCKKEYPALSADLMKKHSLMTLVFDAKSERKKLGRS